MPLRTGPNIFGRRTGNDIVISDPYVSGKHGQIEITDQGVYLTDLGSSNGTYVNEAKLAPNMRTQVGPDDVIRLGSLELRVKLNT
jgi:pSer/pThr/pTyr-binding forkhead associated (FHA) protein